MTTNPADQITGSGGNHEPFILYFRLEQAVISSIIHETLPVALNLLFNLLNTPELVNNPILHAMTHTLTAMNTPLHTRTKRQETSLKNSSGEFWKSVYLTKAEDTLSDLSRERHANGDCEMCQQYAMFGDLNNAQEEVLREDGCECNSVVRLQKVLEKERQKVNEAISQEWHRSMGDVWRQEDIDRRTFRRKHSVSDGEQRLRNENLERSQDRKLYRMGNTAIQQMIISQEESD